MNVKKSLPYKLDNTDGQVVLELKGNKLTYLYRNWSVRTLRLHVRNQWKGIENFITKYTSSAIFHALQNLNILGNIKNYMRYVTTDDTLKY